MRAALCLILVALPLRLAAETPIRLGYFNFPGFIYEADQRAAGPGVALIQALTEGLPVSHDLVRLPVKRLLHELENDHMIAIGLGRTAERERSAIVWVARVFDDDLLFASLSRNGPVDSLDQARGLRAVGVNFGGMPQGYLLDRGFTNIDTANDMSSEVGKLHAGHIDAWFGMRLPILATWRLAGFDPDELVLGKTIYRGEIWIAASPAIDPLLIATLRERFEALRREGRLAAFHLDPP